jgi:hypothetical protein
MDTPLLTAAISAATALIVVALGSWFSRRRLKLDRYCEYVVALSGTIEERMTRESHLRYSDAVNALLLVAPANVLRALDAFLDYTSFRNPHQDINKHDALLGEVIRAMRRDLQPTRKDDDAGLRFRLLGVPPADWIPLKRRRVEALEAAEPAVAADGVAAGKSV